MRNFSSVAILLLACVCFSAGLLPVPGPCPGGTYPTVYTACRSDWHCPRGQYCFLSNPSTNYRFCCPYPPKPFY